MPGGIDHVGHVVRDLDAAAELYRRMGFTVGARNRHTWGTHNYIVQLPGFFIELLTVAEPDKLGEDDISRLFGRFHQAFLARGEGFSLLVLESKDSQVDVAAFRDAGIAASDRVDFEREARRPDGTPIKVGFSLAFAKNDSAPSIRFMTCQQHYPENFWNPAFQTHANGVHALRGVVMVAENPEAQRVFLAAFTGNDDFHFAPGEVSAVTPRGTLSVMTPGRFELMFGVPAPNPSRTVQLAAIRFGVTDVADTRGVFEKAGMPHRNYADGLVIDAKHLLGACLNFEPAATTRG